MFHSSSAPGLLLPLALVSLIELASGTSIQQESDCGQLLDLGQPTPGSHTELGLISADGNVLAGRFSTAGGGMATRWTSGGGYETLDVPPGFSTTWSTAINADGTKIAGTASGTTFASNRPCVWDAVNGVQLLEFPWSSAVEQGSTTHVSADGNVIVGVLWTDVSGFGEFFESFLVWDDNGDLIPTAVSGYGFSRPTALSADGSTVAGEAFNIDYSSVGTPFISSSQAFVWTQSGGSTLIGAADDQFEPVDLSADGSVVLGRIGGAGEARLWTALGGYQATGAVSPTALSDDGTAFTGSLFEQGSLTAYRWTAASGVETLGVPPGGRSLGYFISDDGSVVVGITRNASFEQGAFRWTEAAGWEDIGLGLAPDAFEPEAVSADGSVIGGTNRFGVKRGLLWSATEIGSEYCSSVVNSVGRVASLRACGCDEVAENDLVLVASQMPPNTFGFLLTSRDQSAPTVIVNSVGLLCLGGAIGRFVGPGQVMTSSAAGYDGTGTMSVPVDLTRVPTPTGLIAVQAGETWNFQAWYRDVGATTGPSNLTDAVSVTFL